MKLHLAFLEYPAIEFYSLSQSSKDSNRDLLIALAWLLGTQDVLNVTLRAKLAGSVLGVECSHMDPPEVSMEITWQASLYTISLSIHHLYVLFWSRNALLNLYRQSYDLMISQPPSNLPVSCTWTLEWIWICGRSMNWLTNGPTWCPRYTQRVSTLVVYHISAYPNRRWRNASRRRTMIIETLVMRRIYDGNIATLGVY